MYYHIITFGCQMNVHESEKLAGTLEKLGYNETASLADADVVVFNTCAIREGAQDRAFGNIGNLKRMKRENKNKVIAVCGCMTQQKAEAENIYKKFPFVDIIFGTHNISKFEDLLKQRQKQNKRQLEILEDTIDIWEDFPVYRTSGDNAWVNIMYGCNNFCSYCIVPYVRGREKSRCKERIIEEVKQLVNTRKYKTITLLGQNVNSYGHGLYDDYSFADLLEELCKIEGDFRINFMTSHPKDISDRVIEIMAKNEKISKELHLPIQSGSDDVLRRMNRKYTIEKYLSIVQKVRTAMPNIRLTTDFIVGFPGETDEDFQKSCELIKNVKFDGIFAFMYSPRPGTAAANFENQIDDATKNYRVNILLNLEKKIQQRK